MTNEQLTDLEEKAKASLALGRGIVTEAFTNAANPTAILSLCAQLRASHNIQSIEIVPNEIQELETK